VARELVNLELRVVRDNDRDAAILVQLDGSSPKVWLPRSAIEIEYRRGSTTVATVTLSETLAEEKGLI
jgi:hypothetical protein